MLASVTTFAIDGMESRRVTVEVDIRPGLPAFTIVGLGDRAVREARERVHAAILNSGFEFPQRRVTVNLAPAHMRKAGPGYDLAIACGVLAASGQIPAHTLAGFAVFGELALGGDLRPCRGAIAVAEGAVKAGLGGLVVPPERAAEAALVSGLDIVAAGSLAEAAALIGDDERPTVQTRRPDPLVAGRASVDGPDLADVRGHASVISALIVAAAGGHNMLMSGPPGVGKTMLARRLPSILPPLSPDEALAWGLVSEVVAADGLPARAAELAAELASLPTKAIAMNLYTSMNLPCRHLSWRHSQSGFSRIHQNATFVANRKISPLLNRASDEKRLLRRIFCTTWGQSASCRPTHRRWGAWVKSSFAPGRRRTR